MSLTYNYFNFEHTLLYPAINIFSNAYTTFNSIIFTKDPFYFLGKPSDMDHIWIIYYIWIIYEPNHDEQKDSKKLILHQLLCCLSCQFYAVLHPASHACHPHVICTCAHIICTCLLSACHLQHSSWSAWT